MKKIQMLSMVAVVLLIIVVALGCTPSQAATAPSPTTPTTTTARPKPIEWQVQTNWGTGLLYFKMAEEFAARVKEMSNGRLTLKLQPVGALVADPQIFDACSKGSFEAFMSAPTYWTGRVPACAFLMSVPFTYDEYYQLEVWYWQMGGINIAREVYDKYNLRFIGIFTPDGGTPEAIIMKEGKAIRTVADFQGKKIRVPAGMQGDIMGKLGAAVVNLPGADMYSALQTGVVDGAKAWGFVGNWDMKLHEVTKHFVLTGIQSATALEVTANKDAWEKLTPDLKAIVETAVKEHSQRTFGRINLAEIEIKQKLAAAGKEIIDLPVSEKVKIRKIAQPIWEKWAAKDPLAMKAYQLHVSYMKQLGILK